MASRPGYDEVMKRLAADLKRLRPDLADKIERGLAVALLRSIEDLGGGAWAISNDAGDSWHVAARHSCTCPDATMRGVTCKHMLCIWLMEVTARELAAGPAREAEALLAHFGGPA